VKCVWPARAGLSCPGKLVERAAGEVCETRSVRKRGGEAPVKASDCEVPTRASRSYAVASFLRELLVKCVYVAYSRVGLP
jgi:hypothetical protein